MKKGRTFGSIVGGLVLAIPLLAAAVFAFPKTGEGPVDAPSSGQSQLPDQSEKGEDPSAFVPQLAPKSIEYGAKNKEANEDTTPIYQKGGFILTKGAMDSARLTRDYSIASVEEQLQTVTDENMRASLLASRESFLKQTDAFLFDTMAKSYAIEDACKKLGIAVSKEEGKRMWLDTAHSIKTTLADPADPDYENCARIWNEMLSIMKGMGMTEEQYTDYMADAYRNNLLGVKYQEYFYEKNGYQEKSLEERRQLLDDHIAKLVADLGIENPYA